MANPPSLGIATLLVVTVALVGFTGAQSSQSSSSYRWLSPPYQWIFEFPMPIPPLASPNMMIENPINGQLIQYYEMDILPFSQQIYPDRGPTPLVGYNGITPGPMFILERGQESVVRIVNRGNRDATLHLHGSPTRAPWDGWAEDVMKTMWYKDYYYPNIRNGRTIWYHDHAMGTTAYNAYIGQAGPWIIHDSDEDALGLPHTYGIDDIPVMVCSKQYNQDGTLYWSEAERQGLWGDVIHVNGQPWPYFAVLPKRYRLRLLNSAISRAFIFYFVSDDQNDDSDRITFQVIASDSGLLSAPQTTSTLRISSGERYEIIIDFSHYVGQNITLRNERRIIGNPDYAETDKVMRFVVSSTPVTDTTSVPSSLRHIDTLSDEAGVDHQFRFEREGNDWTINGVKFSDVRNRVLARVPVGTVEKWELLNVGPQELLHPVHLHLVDFRIIGREGGQSRDPESSENSGSSTGSKKHKTLEALKGHTDDKDTKSTSRDLSVQPYESSGLKDVVWVGPGERVTVEAHYGPWIGAYMFHCHNLVHEDHEMMAVFNVTELSELGYDNMELADPMDPRWLARPVREEAFEEDAIRRTVQEMAMLSAYTNPQKRGIGPGTTDQAA